MNALNTTRRGILHLWALVLVTLGLSSALGLAAEKGGERLQSMSKVRTFEDLENLQAGDKFVMVCGKCQTVMMHKVSKDKGREIPMMTAEHKCTGCNSTITSVGHGKGKTDKVSHACGGCGDGSVFCCTAKKEGKATEGMEKH